MKPLRNIKVLDLSRVLAGPLCAQSLGDLGAEVTKVETLETGDESRMWPPFYEGTATAFTSANRNKKSIAINLKEPKGQEMLHRLVANADVVIESAATGVSARLGADYDTLRKINNKLIYCTISGFGRDGPAKDKRGYDVILQAYSGMMSFIGDPDTGAVRIPFSPIDQATGHHATTGVLAALIERGQTGQGALVELSLLDTAVSFLGYVIQAYVAEGKLPVPAGSGHPGIVPYQAFHAADKPVLIGVANDKLWAAFCRVFDRSDLAADPRFHINKERVTHRASVVAAVQEVVKDMPAADLIAQLEAAGIPNAPIHTIAELLSDPQVIARGLVQEIGQSGMQGTVLPIRFNNETRSLGNPSPALGQDTDAILQELGYSYADRQALLASGTIGQVVVS